MHHRFASLLLLAGFVILSAIPPTSAQEGVASQSLGAGTRDSKGTVYWLDRNGMVTVGQGVGEDKTFIKGFEPQAQVQDVGIDSKGALVVAMTLVDASDKGRPTLRGQLEIYDSQGVKRHEVKLEERWWPQRVAEFQGRIAVLGSSPEHGYAIDFVDSSYRLLPDARVYVSLECGGLDLLDMAVDETGIWVAALERCERGYVVRKYDTRGNILTELSGVLEPFAGEKPEGSVTPALKGIFVTSKYVGVMLNRMSEGGVLADLWTPSGEFVERVSLPGIRSAFLRVVPTSSDEVDVLEFDHGTITPLKLSALQGGGR